MHSNKNNGLLSVFCGAGGLDLGFEAAGFEIELAFDIRPDAIISYNENRNIMPATGHCKNVCDLNLAVLDELAGKVFRPVGVIGGPPCQSFSQANRSPVEGDPRHDLPFVYARLIGELNARSPLNFFVLENVATLRQEPHAKHFDLLKTKFREMGFNVFESVLDARNYGVPQKRERLILVGLNSTLHPQASWVAPLKLDLPAEQLTVRHAFKDLPEPAHFRRGLSLHEIAFHPNHWCMAPKSKKFSTPGALVEGRRGNRSFKTLSWDKPSVTVAYGNREVHIHPDCGRRLSVLEAMRLQGFPDTYQLKGSLSSQITQVSEAVPPPMAKAVAESLIALAEVAKYRDTLDVTSIRPRKLEPPQRSVS